MCIPAPLEHTGNSCYLHSQDIPARGLQSDLKFKFTKRAKKVNISILIKIGFYFNRQA
jgi:sulfur transfer complex TusBCD TusB component (DsrH family)